MWVLCQIRLFFSSIECVSRVSSQLTWSILQILQEKWRGFHATKLMPPKHRYVKFTSFFPEQAFLQFSNHQISKLSIMQESYLGVPTPCFCFLHRLLSPGTRIYPTDALNTKLCLYFMLLNLGPLLKYANFTNIFQRINKWLCETICHIRLHAY